MELTALNAPLATRHQHAPIARSDIMPSLQVLACNALLLGLNALNALPRPRVLRVPWATQVQLVVLVRLGIRG